MIDLRHFALTIMAIFLALTVGLILGSALASPERQSLVYEKLRRDFDQISDENKRVREEKDAEHRRNEAQDRALREFVSGAVRDRLSDSRVAVLICGPVDEGAFWGDLEGTLRLAGARVGPILHVPDRFHAIPSADRERFHRMWGQGTATAASAEMEPAGWLVQALAREGSGDRVNELIRTLGLEQRGRQEGPARRLLVLTAAPAERLGSLAAGETPEPRILDTARELGLRVVVAEPQEPTSSAVDTLRSRSVTTVDNVDTAAGQISVVLALAGAEGRFGSKKGASAPIPPLRTP